MNDMKHIVIVSVAVLMLSGCGSVLPKGEPAPRLYTLNATAAQPETNIAVLPVSLKIMKPQIAPGLDTERVALRRNDNQLDYYADVRWAGDASTMIQSLLVENFESTKRLKSVSNDLVTLRHDYTLLTDIRDFQVNYKNHNKAQARIRMTITVVKAQSDDIMRTFHYDRTEQVANEDMNSIAKAFDTAQQSIMQQLVSDVMDVLQH
jgi:cholesterol transport system auxiliary component